MQGNKNLRPSSPTRDRNQHRKSSRMAYRGGGFTEPRSQNADLAYRLNYLYPAPSNKAAKLVGRKKRCSREQSRHWEFQFRSAARAALR